MARVRVVYLPDTDKICADVSTEGRRGRMFGKDKAGQ